MALTVVEGFFGAAGVSDPVCTMPEATIGREIDFSKANVEKGKNYPLMPIPAGFVVTDVIVEQTVATDQNATLSLKVASTGTAVVSDVAVKNDGALHRKATSLGANAVFAPVADMLCVCTPDTLTNDKIAKGKIAVYLRGFCSFGEGVVSAPAGTEAWRKPLQTADNVSGGPIA